MTHSAVMHKWIKIRSKMRVWRIDRKTNVEYSSTPEFFFLDDMLPNYNSVSIGEVWLYFYKQTLIGVRDMRFNKAAFLHISERAEPDGYSHRHEIDNMVVECAMVEPYPNLEPPHRLPADELTSLALAWVADGLVKHVDHALTP